MAEIAIGVASVDEVRRIQRRRDCDEAAIRLSLESSERGLAWAAREPGEIVGIAIAHDSEDERHTGDLYVEPSFRGHGIGEKLLSAAFEDTGDRGRSVLADSADPASLALALRHGMTLREPILRFAGAIPREEELARMAAGDYRFEVAEIDAAIHTFGLRALDRQTRGTTRDADHVSFASGAAGHAFFLNGEFVAYAYVWPDGRIGPLACASQAYLVQIFAYALLALTRRYGASWCSALVPGSNLRIARTALRAGLVVNESLLLASDAVGLELSTYIGYHYLAF